MRRSPGTAALAVLSLALAFAPSVTIFSVMDRLFLTPLPVIDRLPRTMVVVGGGVIGCEYAAMFAAMRVGVTLVEGRPRLLQFLDEEIAERLRGAMHALGVTFLLGRTTKSIRRVEGRGIVTTLDDGAEIDAEKILASSGRSGATAGLGLEALGIEVDKRGTVKVDGDFRTTAPNIYAAGGGIGFPAPPPPSVGEGGVPVGPASR